MESACRLRLKFWGVRGSIPTPQAEHFEFGGNTACLEIRAPGEEVLIFDAGTGIRELGLLLDRENTPPCNSLHLFLTHYHWDHIQGIPFFSPLYSARNRVVFYGHGQVGHPRNLLIGQMQAPYFPVDMDLAAAQKEFDLLERDSRRVGPVSIQPFPLNHPQGAIGYRVEHEGAVVVYATDLEHGHPRLDRVLRDYADGADVLIYDAQYSPEEYDSHRGWGHSTWLEATRVAADCRVGQLVLFHHDPSHDSRRLREMVAQAQRYFPATIAAREGWMTEL
jgi:phosphoribosyl 1,2-cyclic phosphodiesterase